MEKFAPGNACSAQNFAFFGTGHPRSFTTHRGTLTPRNNTSQSIAIRSVQLGKLLKSEMKWNRREIYVLSVGGFRARHHHLFRYRHRLPGVSRLVVPNLDA